MNKHKILMLFINIIGGTAVITSYALGLKAHPGQIEALWGGVPVGLRPLYTGNMFFAAVGYLLVLYFMLFRVKATVRLGILPLWTINLLYLLILVPSALWMSLTFKVADQYTLGRWLAVVTVLVLTGLASIGLLISLLALEPRPLSRSYWFSLAGGLFLVLQTAVLDATIWTAYYLK